MEIINFNFGECISKDKEHIKTKQAIAKRLHDIILEVHGEAVCTSHIAMDLDVLGGIFEIDWDKLLNFPNNDLCHDYFGFVRRLDRGEHTWENDCFVPRCTKREVKNDK